MYQDSNIEDQNSKQDQFNILLTNYEGPIDLLLDLAKKQKVDLSEISVLELAQQYINFIGNLNQIHLEVAADYLVMAAWLTYLKSRLLLPKDEKQEVMKKSGMNAEQLKMEAIKARKELEKEGIEFLRS